jgi:hypothetical protein
VPGSTTGARAVYEEGTRQGAAEWGSSRWRHSGEAEEGLRGGGTPVNLGSQR